VKRKKTNMLSNKTKAATSQLGSMCPVTARQQAFLAPGFLDAHIAENRQECERWLAATAARKPAPLGPLRFDYDEDGVPTSLD
jgi:hypothetical protein